MKPALLILGAWLVFKWGKAVNEQVWRERLGLDEPDFEETQREMAAWQ